MPSRTFDGDGGSGGSHHPSAQQRVSGRSSRIHAATPTHDAMADRPVVLIGAGDHARVLIDVLRVLGRQILYATDHNPQVYGSMISGVIIRGGDEHVFSQDPDKVLLINAVGSVNR